jgi:hypothetical protein
VIGRLLGFSLLGLILGPPMRLLMRLIVG